MFEIHKDDSELMEHYKEERSAYKGAEYDFTFGDRYLIYHAPMRGRIIYMAVDKMTSRSSEVCRRDSSSDNEYMELIPNILNAVKYTGDPYFTDAIIHDPFGAIDLLFHVVLPKHGFTIRKEQIQLCKQMYIGLTEKQAAICEAEVGSGKSLAYLIAALCAKENRKIKYNCRSPVTITTSSIELQNTLVEKEIPQLSVILLGCRLIKKPLTAVLRKGKEHYFCRYRFEDYLNSIKKHPQKYADQIKAIQEMRLAEKAFDLDKAAISAFLKKRICVKGACGKCVYAGDCRYAGFIGGALDKERNIDFQVTNHNMYIMSAVHSHILRESSLVIIDEAHKFKEAAQDVFGERICEKDIPCYLNWAKNQCRDKASLQQYHKYWTEAARYNKQLFMRLHSLAQGNAWDSDGGSVISMSSDLIWLVARLHENLSGFEQLRRNAKGRCELSGSQLCASLWRFLFPEHINIWVDLDENGLAYLCCGLKNIGKALTENVWDRDISHVLTSGTMSDGADFQFFKRETGLDRLPKHLLLESSASSPFDYANHARLYIPENMPMPNNGSKEYIEAIAEQIVRLVRLSNGHTAILFTSYKVLQAVYACTERRLKEYDVICMTRSNKTAIADFKKRRNAVLFASGSMWEGVDCIGDSLSSVIIVRLPFPVRSAAMEEKKNACASIPEFIQTYAVPEMLLKLRQGAGRLIRSETDTGLLTILDARAAQGGAYRGRVLQALKMYPLVYSIADIAEFFRKVKPPEYFK